MSYHKYSKYPMCISILIALAFTAACGLQPFSSVRIKAKPTVYVPLGEKSITEAEVFTKLEETLQKNNKNIRLYRYQPSGGDDKLRYLVYYPLQTLELDISKYFNGDPLGNGGSGDNAALSQNFEKKISVPNLQQKKDVPIDVSGINQELLNRFNTGTAIPITISPAIPQNTPYTLSQVNVSFQGFKKITFENGAKLKLLSNPSTVHYTITQAEMKSNGHSVPGTINGQDIEFPLNGITISNELGFKLTVKITSGSGTISLGTKLEGVIKKVTGVNAADIDVSLVAQTISLSLPTEFEKATIAAGSMKFTAQMPNEWSGITIEEKMKVEQGGVGGFSIIPSDYRPLGNPISLENQKLNNQSTLSCTPAFNVKLNNATYTKQNSLPVTLALDIKKFKEITLQNPPGLTVNREQDVPQDMKDWVKEIKFKTVSAKIKLDNGLPAGNDIKIELSSTSFKMLPPQERVFVSGKTEQEYSCNGGTAFDLDIEHLPKFDLKMQVILPNTTGTTFTLKNIETGKDITLSGSIQFNPDWEEIILKAKADQNISFPQTGKMDLSELTSKLKTAGIQLEEIPVYFYAGSDSGLLGSTKMNVKLTATYIKTGETTDTSAVLVDKNNVALKALPVGTFPSDKIFTGAIPDAMLSIKQGESGITNTLAGIMNDYPKGLQLTCTLNMNEITITSADYNNLKNKKPKVSIDLVLDVPVGFKVESDHPLSLMDMFGINMSGADLFGRRSAHDKPFGLDDQILDSLQALNVHINLKNDLSGPVPKCILRFKDGSGNAIKGDSNKPIKKEIAAAAGEQTVKLTSSELKKLLEKYPVSPELVLELPQGSYSLKRDFKLGASITVLAETDINYSMKVN
jgi:putative lipoprotein